MAKVTRYIKLKRPNTGEIVNIKLGEVKIIDPVNEKYTILSYGDNLADFVFKNKNVQFQIVGTNNTISFDFTGDGSYNNPYNFLSSFRGYNKNNIFSSNGGVFWSSPNLYPSLSYEPNYGLLFGITYYQIYKTDKTNKLVAFEQIDAPYTPPNVYSQQTNGSWTIITAGKNDITGQSEFTNICNAINTTGITSLSETNSVFYNALKNWTDNPDTGEPTESPFDIEYGFPGEPSSPQGGNGDMKDTNEPVALTPSDITNVAYPVRCYRLSRANVSALHGYLWSNDFITNLPKLFSDPFSAIVGIQAIPYISPTEESNIIIGTLDTNIVANKVTLYYVTVDLGSIDVKEYWQNFLDYQPYTRLKLFLPYIGIVDLPTDLFMNNSVAIKYRIDIISGACVAVVSNRDNVICTFTGNCSTKIPLSNNDHSNAIGNTLVGIAGLAGSVATGNAVGAVANTASIVAGLKERIQISGSLSTAHGILINDKPFLMIERPDTEIPENYAGLKGYTSNISMKLSATSGFTKISDIKLDGLSCTDAEKEELLNMMQNGIYL